MIPGRHGNHDFKTVPLHRMVDPVCGMAVSDASYFHLKRNGVQYAFCSEGCRDEFMAHPDRYVDKADETPRH